MQRPDQDIDDSGTDEQRRKLQWRNIPRVRTEKAGIDANDASDCLSLT
jgi:hypothetical protein